MKKNIALQEFCRVAKISQPAEFYRLRNAFPATTVHHACHFSLSCNLLIFDFFWLHFLFLPILTLVIAFGFGFLVICKGVWL